MKAGSPPPLCNDTKTTRDRHETMNNDGNLRVARSPPPPGLMRTFANQRKRAPTR